MTAGIEEIEIFESLGDNCEFGFVQRNLGHEPGGLLRWAISRPEPLARMIRSGGEGLYQFDHLVPSAPDMVDDLHSGLYFHSRMYSRDGVFLADEAERRAIWQEELQKVAYLTAKLMEQIESGSRIFVYKTNAPVSDDEAGAIAGALRARGPAQLLCVRHTGDMPVGAVRHGGANLWFGRIDRFAEYHQADDVSMAAWQTLLGNALAQIRR